MTCNWSPTAERRAIRPLQAQPTVGMSVAQTPEDGTRGELCAAPGGHAELLQHQPRLLRPHRAGPGPGARRRGGGGGRGKPTRAARRQDELRGEGPVQRADAHLAAPGVPFPHPQHAVQEHARTGEEGDSDAGYCSRWVRNLCNMIITVNQLNLKNNWPLWPRQPPACTCTN